MRVSDSSEKTAASNDRHPEVEESAAPVANPALSQFVKAEANLLRLPLFALHTKGLKTLDGIECRGRSSRDGETQDYLFRVTRNTSSLYPGPLSRKIHFALLSIATERGFPLQNPVTWSWRDLCRRMGIAYGGKTKLRQLKAAIRSTHGIVITTRFALYARAEKQALPNRERGYHFYSDYAFINEPLPGGGIAEVNCVWFADWFLDNLNALFSAPLDYELWRSLDLQSSIASRLYEFLLLNFYSGTPLLRINYPTLAQFLPVHREPYRSLALRQLEPAFKLLQNARVLEAVQWSEAKDGTPQLQLFRGDRLSAPRTRAKDPLPFADDPLSASIHVNELRNLKPPEWTLVTEFYRLWAKDERHQPTGKELAQGRELVETYGLARAKALVPLIVKRMQDKWPDANSFGAITKYAPEVADEYQKKQHRAEQERQDQARELQDDEARARRLAELEQHRPRWLALSDEERADIRHHVLSKQPYLSKHPKLVERFCLGEMVRRQQATAGDAV
jgi:hypothetical protein